jgi:Ca2+/H+ antiporter, TMEM165/GDT1 family
MKRRFRIRKVLGILLLVIIGVLAFGSIVMVLWNGVMPQIFHLPLITFWQALGLFALAKILFSSFRGGPRGHWRMDKLKEGWANMTPEQQERFKQEWGRRCRKPFPPSESHQGGNPNPPNADPVSPASAWPLPK